MDESNDVTDTAQLLIFIRGIDATFTVHELGGLCTSKGATTGEDLFLKAQETLASLEFSWKKLNIVTTDGGKSMCGSKTGVVGRICKEAMQVGSETPMVFYCIIHQEALCCQILSLKGNRFGDVDWIHLAQDRDRWRALVNTVMNLRVP
jgi:hypothetical protein